VSKNYKPSKQHYLPQVYLRGFAHDNEKLKVYSLKQPYAKISSKSIKGICYEPGLYDTDDENGEKTDEIEKVFFAKHIEPIFNRLLATVKDKKWLSNSDIADLSIYISLQLLRLPSSFRVINNLMTDSLVKNGYHKIETLPNNKETIDDREVILKISKDDTIRAAFSLATPLSDKLCRMKWIFMFAPRGTAFITSDMPVAVISPESNGYSRTDFGGFGLPGAITIFPLSKDICIFLQNGDYGQSFPTISKHATKDINGVMSDKFVLYLISHSKKLLQSFAPKLLSQRESLT